MALEDRIQAARRWIQALSSPTEQNVAALVELVADDVVTVSPMGSAEGKAAVLAGFGPSPITPFLAEASWAERAIDSRTVEIAGTFPTHVPVGGITLRVTFDEDARISRVETDVRPIPPPQATEIKITDTMRSALEGALFNRTPITVAYVDADGQPHVSLRGTTQVFSDDQLAVWIRNPKGGLLSAIESNPRVTLFYRDPATRTTYQFQGRARADHSEATRDRVYSNSPEPERNLDLRRSGVAVVIDLDKIEGRDASGAFLMEGSSGK